MFAGGQVSDVNARNVVSETAQNARVETWDGWRGTAIVLVLCGHFFDIKWLWEDRMGVDIFFVLSGMLMSTILFEKRLSLRDFYIRRLSRIIPALFAYVAVIYTISWLYSINFSAREVVSSLLFLRTYYPAEPGIWDTEVAIGHLWSLNVEEHAYILLSLITLILLNRKRIAWVLLGLAVISMALSIYHFTKLPADAFPLYLIRTESAVVFILLSAGYGLLRRQAGWNLPSWVPVVCFAVAVVCYAQNLPLWLIITASPVMLAITVNHLDNLPKLAEWLLSLPVLRYLGLWSYSIYLWQQFFYEYQWAFPYGKIVAPILAIVIGIISYYFFENPIRHYINNKWSKHPKYHSNEKTA